MKKEIVCALGLAGVACLCGCQSAFVTNYGFGSTMPGLLYNDQTRGTFILPKMQSMKDVTVLGKVSGTSKATNVLMLFAKGDSGIASAKKDALRQYPDADDIVNIEVDVSHTNILPVFNVSTTRLSGIAIKYKK